MTRNTRVLLVRLGGAALIVAAIAFWMKPLTGLAVYASGRANGCSLDSTMQSLTVFDQQEKHAAEFKAASRRVKRDEAAGVDLWQTPNGEVWTPAGEESDELFYDMAEQKRGIYSTAGHGVKPGDVVLDCGANVGLYARTALAEGASKVVAIEPVPANVECLRRNLAKEIAAGKVVVVAKGVWDKEDWLEMSISKSNWAKHSFVRGEGEDAKVKLPLTTIDRLASELGLAKVDYIKMDIEGAERNALAGAQATLRRDHPRMALCVYHLSDDPKVLPQRARTGWAGYRIFSGTCEPGGGGVHEQVQFYE